MYIAARNWNKDLAIIERSAGTRACSTWNVICTVGTVRVYNKRDDLAG